MKLSEEMVLGSTMIRHVHHVGNEVEEGCALQCAGTAAGPKRRSSQKRHPWADKILFEYPCECVIASIPVKAFEIIMHLNDRHKWSIDEIAQWVASVEPLSL